MLELNPQFLKKNGRKDFVVLTVQEYRRIQQRLEDAEDLMELRSARESQRGMPTITLDELRAQLCLKGKRMKKAGK